MEVINSLYDMRTGGPWLANFFSSTDDSLCDWGFIAPSLLTVVFTVVIWESSQWLGQSIMQSSGNKKTSKKSLKDSITGYYDTINRLNACHVEGWVSLVFFLSFNSKQNLKTVIRVLPRARHCWIGAKKLQIAPKIMSEGPPGALKIWAM